MSDRRPFEVGDSVTSYSLWNDRVYRVIATGNRKTATSPGEEPFIVLDGVTGTWSASHFKKVKEEPEEDLPDDLFSQENTYG